MPENNLAEKLKNRPLVVQGRWYRLVAGAKDNLEDKKDNLGKKKVKKVKQDYINEAKRKCRDYFIPEEGNEIATYLASFTGDRQDLQREMDPLLDQIISQGVVAKVEKAAAVATIRAEELVEWAEVLGSVLAVEIKTAQIRRFLGAVLKVDTEVRKGGRSSFDNRQVVFLKVHLAYAAGRHKGVRPLLQVMVPLLERVRPAKEDGWQDFRELVRFVQAVVAYHKFYGGSE